MVRGATRAAAARHLLRQVLMGAAGIALSLLAGATAIEPRWDRMLMTAVPPR